MGITKYPHCTDSLKCKVLDYGLGLAAYSKIA